MVAIFPTVAALKAQVLSKLPGKAWTSVCPMHIGTDCLHVSEKEIKDSKGGIIGKEVISYDIRSLQFELGKPTNILVLTDIGN